MVRCCKEKESNVKPFWNYFCAKDGKGVDLLINSLFKILPLGPPLFPEDILTDYPRKLNMGDIIRENYLIYYTKKFHIL